jgi:hypothetical protein
MLKLSLVQSQTRDGQSPERLQTQNPNNVSTRENLHFILTLQATDGSVFTVKAILQVDLGLTNEVICPNHIMVIDQDGQQGLLWECGLNLK